MNQRTIERKRDLLKVSKQLAKTSDGYSEMSRIQKIALVAITYKTLDNLDK